MEEAGREDEAALCVRACRWHAASLRRALGCLEGSRDGQWLQTFAIITTDPNELTGEIHDRMPVILHPKDYDRWLYRGELEPPPMDLLRPYEAEAMRAWKADPRVGSVRNNEAGLCEEWR